MNPIYTLVALVITFCYTQNAYCQLPDLNETLSYINQRSEKCRLSVSSSGHVILSQTRSVYKDYDSAQRQDKTSLITWTTEYTLNPFDTYAEKYNNELMVACYKTDEGKLPNCITYKVLDEIIPKGHFRIGDNSYLVIRPNLGSNDELEALVLAYNHLLEMAKSIYSKELTERKSIDPFLSAASNPSSGTDNEVVIPILNKGGVYEVPVEINRMLKLNFILDSGASDVFISENIATTLITGGTITDVDIVGRQIYTLADGSTEECLVINLRSVKIGTIEIKNVMCGVSKSIHAPMLLGQSFLKRFGSFTLDNKSNTLTFRK